jgi:hypothetical protein
MKELHRQGVRVRSRRIGRGTGYEIVPIGERRKRASSDPFAARRARADPFARRSPRTVPVRRHEPEYRARPVSAYGNPQYYRRAVPNRSGQYPVSSSYHGPKTSISGKIVDWNEQRMIRKHQEKLKEIEYKKSLTETNEKMKQERVAREREEIAKMRIKQDNKDRLRAEAEKFKEEQRIKTIEENRRKREQEETLKIAKQGHGGPTPEEQRERHRDEAQRLATQNRGGQSSYEYHGEAPIRETPEGSRKITAADIQQARVNMIEEGE